eukprot:jgi/Mesen1/4437/ME000225S03426
MLVSRAHTVTSSRKRHTVSAADMWQGVRTSSRLRECLGEEHLAVPGAQEAPVHTRTKHPHSGEPEKKRLKAGSAKDAAVDARARSIMSFFTKCS